MTIQSSTVTLTRTMARAALQNATQAVNGPAAGTGGRRALVSLGGGGVRGGRGGAFHPPAALACEPAGPPGGAAGPPPAPAPASPVQTRGTGGPRRPSGC